MSNERFFFYNLSFSIISLSLKRAGKKKEFLALVDSGATISIFRSEVAESLKINIENGKKVYLGGVGGRLQLKQA